MKLLTAQQIKDWDQFTIENEPIASIDLMERAANACVSPITEIINHSRNQIKHVAIFCGRGNNGGDGLAIARLLKSHLPQIQSKVYILAHTEQATFEFTENENRLKAIDAGCMHYLASVNDFPKEVTEDTLIIDAITGTGLKNELHGLTAELVKHLNHFNGNIIAIDIPSGLQAEVSDHVDLGRQAIIKAKHTLTFQVPKYSFLHAESAEYVGEFQVLSICLHPEYLNKIHTHFHYTDAYLASGILRERLKFYHKGSFGHLLTIGGSYGKMGASVLMNKAGLRTGCGLVTAFIPKVGYTILQTAMPECMVFTDDEITEIRHFPYDLSNYSAVAVGPGMGLNEYTIKGFYNWLEKMDKPCVLDADALNICSRGLMEHHETFRFPKHCIITPHPKEFDRLAGISKNSYERLEKQIYFAVKYKITVVLKGAHTSIVTPDGQVFFNSTGNVAMATGGSGDALTGIIGSLLAQGYSDIESAILGVYLHGLSGDLAAENKTTIIASDIIEKIPEALNKMFTQRLS